MDKYAKRFWIFLAAITGVHALYGAVLGLGDDEAYYWEWGQHLDLSYLDHPPLVAWIGRLTTALPGNTELGVRLGAILFSALFLVLLYRLSVKLFGSTRQALITAVFVSTIPLFAVGGFMMVPDAVLALCWMAAIYCFWTIVAEKKARGWYVLGVIFGLGLLGKYNMIALPLCVLTFLALSKEERFWLRRPEPYLALVIGLIVFMPVVAWNWQRGFPSFAYHLIERNRSSGWSWRPFQLYLGGQFGYLSPLVFVGSVAAMIVAGRRGIAGHDKKMLFLFAMSAPYVLLFSTACSVSPTTKPHWPAMGYVASFLVMAMIYCRAREDRAARMRRTVIGLCIAAFVISLVMTVVLHVQALYPVARLKPSVDVTNELHGWPMAGAAISREVHALESLGRPVLLVTPRYNIASQVAFYTKEHFPAYSISGVREQFDIWGRGDLDGREGDNALFIADNRYNRNPAERLRFDSVEKLPAVEFQRAGRTVRWFYLYRCLGYRGKAGEGGKR